MTLAPMTLARNGHLVLATDTAVYALGGTSGEVKASNHCEMYDPRTNVWTEVTLLAQSTKGRVRVQDTP